MNCTENKELLVAFVEGLLDEPQRHKVTEHLRDCPSCRTEVEQLRSLQDRLVGNGKTLARSDLENDVMNKIVREQNVRLKAAGKAAAGLKLRRIIMTSKITRIAAAAAVLVVAALGVHYMMGPSITFADVVKPILNARTVVFDFIVGSDETGPAMHDVVVGSKIRRTFSNMETVLIIDIDNAKMLTLDPKTKGAAYVDIQGPLQEGTRNFLEMVRRAVTDMEGIPVQELGRRNIDGREAIGFEAKDPHVQLTIWADPETAMPIRIELLFGQTLYILKNIEFDVPVEDSLVSMDLPAGYTLSGKQFDMSQFTEQDFTTMLRLWVEHTLNGNFPDSLNFEDAMKLAPQIGEKIDQLDLSEEQKMQLGMTLGRGFVFFQQLESSGAAWHYAGAGVKLGDAEKAVFWYQPRNSSNFRIIYGDLSAKDVAPEDLPK
ncbi:MAG: zf-HC2 domain-containing protein [Phycisphaerales bacterium]|nr:MAG: zf-HC2 domain-containing protein [Phycisphaerales bacterium]